MVSAVLYRTFPSGVRSYRCLKKSQLRPILVLRAHIAIRPVFAFLLFCLGPSIQPEPPTPAAEQEAIQLIQQGRAADAARLLRGSLCRNSSDAGLWNLLGIAEGEQGHNTEAIEAFRKGITLAPRSPSLYENLGLLYYRTAAYRDAERVLAKAVDLGSKKPEVRFSLAASRIQNGKAGEALADLRALEPALGQRGEYWTERGMAELASNPAAASESFDRALTIMPRNLRALNGAAWAAEKRKKDEEALSFLIRARAAAPHDVRTLLHFTLVCLRRNLGPDAIASAKRHTGWSRRTIPRSIFSRARKSLSKSGRVPTIYSTSSRAVFLRTRLPGSRSGGSMKS